MLIFSMPNDATLLKPVRMVLGPVESPRRMPLLMTGTPFFARHSSREILLGRKTHSPLDTFWSVYHLFLRGCVRRSPPSEFLVSQFVVTLAAGVPISSEPAPMCSLASFRSCIARV